MVCTPWRQHAEHCCGVSQSSLGQKCVGPNSMSQNSLNQNSVNQNRAVDHRCRTGLAGDSCRHVRSAAKNLRLESCLR